MKLSSNKLVMKRHLLVLFIIFVLTLSCLSIRVIYINTTERNYQTNVLAQHVNNQTESDELPAKRGSIVDRNGIVLAESLKVYNVIYDPSVLKQFDQEVIDATNVLLSSSLENVTVASLNDILTNNPTSHYEVLVKELEYNQVKKVEEAINSQSIKGVFLESYYRRLYPYDSMACDILGFYNNSSGGSYGIEEYYDNFLSGSHGRLFGSLDDGSIVNQEDIEAQNGDNVILTIDFSIQKYVEEAIEAFYKEHEAKSVNVIVMDPKNGEVLGMASYPNFNVNDPYDLTHLYEQDELDQMSTDEQYDILYGLWKNFLISDSYEPGSTFKPFVLSAAIEENKLQQDQLFKCEGYSVVFDRVIHCWKVGGHGIQTASEALANSCNVAFMQIGDALGKDQLYNYEYMFGFGAETNIDLMGEGTGILFDYDKLNPVELATSSFGQGFNITPIQLISGFSALINGGYLYEPHVMKQIVDENDKLVENKEPLLVRQALSSQISKQITLELETVVAGGTGKRAAIEGYDIGGKTGTAEKGDRDEDRYIISFIGFAPVNDPQIITLVVIDEPVVEEAESGLASDVFVDVMSKVLPYRGIFPNVEVVSENIVETENEATQDSTNQSEVENSENDGIVTDLEDLQTDDSSTTTLE